MHYLAVLFIRYNAYPQLSVLHKPAVLSIRYNAYQQLLVLINLQYCLHGTYINFSDAKTCSTVYMVGTMHIHNFQYCICA